MLMRNMLRSFNLYFVLFFLWSFSAIASAKKLWDNASDDEEKACVDIVESCHNGSLPGLLSIENFRTLTKLGDDYIDPPADLLFLLARHHDIRRANEKALGYYQRVINEFLRHDVRARNLMAFYRLRKKGVRFEVVSKKPEQFNDLAYTSLGHAFYFSAILYRRFRKPLLWKNGLHLASLCGHQNAVFELGVLYWNQDGDANKHRALNLIECAQRNGSERANEFFKWYDGEA